MVLVIQIDGNKAQIASVYGTTKPPDAFVKASGRIINKYVRWIKLSVILPPP